MTRAFDRTAADRPSLFDVASHTPALEDVSVRVVPVRTIRRAIVVGHYSGVMPDAVQEAVAAFDGLTLVAAVAFGPGGNAATFNAVFPGSTSSTARELVRLWVIDGAPKNTASFVVARAMRLLPADVSLVVSFADSGQGHLGTVYQSLNFRYLGMSSEGTRYVDSSGVEVTSRLANVYRMRNPTRFGDMTLAHVRQELGWTPVVSHQKHRYAIGCGRRRRAVNRVLDAACKPYPKMQMEVMS